MQVQERSAIPRVAAVERRASANTIKATAQSCAPSARAAVAQLLRRWWSRELQRRELSMLSPRDFGDLAVPQSLVKEEVIRWPWQPWSKQWSQVTDKRGDPMPGSKVPSGGNNA
jgi:uncharacterized protein YjiS (DUF1127 family)